MTARVRNQSYSESLERAYRHLLGGRYGKAAKSYRKLVLSHPENALWSLELACALAGAGKLDQAKALLEKVDGKELSEAERSRLLTARAWIAAHSANSEQARQLIERAVATGDVFPPAHISLARILAFSDRDFEQAREQMKLTDREGQADGSVFLHRIAIELESNSFPEAVHIASEYGRGVLATPKISMAGLLSRLVASPQRGFLAVVAFSLLVFVPFLGPALYSGTTLLLIGYVILLRRISPRFIAYPITYWASMSGIYLARLIFWGRVFP